MTAWSYSPAFLRALEATLNKRASEIAPWAMLAAEERALNEAIGDAAEDAMRMVFAGTYYRVMMVNLGDVTFHLATSLRSDMVKLRHEQLPAVWEGLRDYQRTIEKKLGLAGRVA